MIELLIYYLHLIGVLYAFTKNWQARGIKEGFLSVIVIGLFFTIGWALTGTIARAIYPDKFNTIYFNSDTFSLILLLIPEIIFYYFYIIKDKTDLDNTENVIL